MNKLIKADSFKEIVEQYKSLDLENYFKKVSEKDVISSINRTKLRIEDFLNLLAPKAQKYLELMAERARDLTVQFFGRTISLYIPLYISNYCNSACVYCGFNRKNKITRVKLNLEEIERELKAVAETGMRHILLLTGESPQATPPKYIQKAVQTAKKYFPSVSIEVYPMQVEDYKLLKNSGVDGLTIYQEVYDKKIYKEVHLAGEKKDYEFRLNTPERAAKAEIPFVNIGTLYGLGEKRKEAFLSGLHAKYLQDKYLKSMISISLPRLNDAEGSYKAKYPVSDRDYVQFLLAFRLFLPKVGINVSTRETPEFRNNLLQLGVTKLSAGSVTEVGGYCEDDSPNSPQFEINDNRTVNQVIQMLNENNFQPIYKDWEVIK